MMRIVTIIQARTGSSRLPNKVLLPLGGKSLLQQMLERIRAAKFVGKIVVATTKDPSDDVIEKLSDNENIACYRGDALDLLDRHYQAASLFDADAVVKIPSDCPLIDPAIIDSVLYYFLQHPNQFDYVSNLHPPTFPDGNDVEIMTMNALSIAWKEAKKDFEREHTTPFFWENPSKFRIGNVKWDRDLDYSMTHRWTIDYEEDYTFIKTVFNKLFPVNPLFGLNDILRLLEENPEIKTINEKFCGINWYRHHLDDLNTISNDQTKEIFI
jgi:spore coat polysaccharide biosynthesis protein SpsF